MTLKVREIFCKRWILKKSTAAITLYPFIFYNIKHRLYREELRELVSHEMEHITQIRKRGVLKFYWDWVRETIKKGYRNNKFEVAAREKAAEEIKDS